MSSGIADALQQLSPVEFHLLQLLLFVASLFLLNRLFQHYRQLRLVADTPSSRIASAAQGLVELQGLAEWMPGDHLVSPFSGQRCVWYRCRIERRKRLHNRSHWVEDRLEVSDRLFRLVDETGECIVDPEGARIVSRHRRRWYGNRIQQSRQPGLARFNFGLGLNPKYRFSETLIQVADPLHVVGEFRTQHNTLQQRDEERQIDEIVAEWKKYPARYLREFDFDGNNRINGSEWLAVREKARHLLREARGPAVNRVGKPRQPGQPFLISALDEAAIIRQRKIGMLLSLLGFLLLSYLLIFATQLRS